MLLVTSTLVEAELVWTLESSYQRPPAGIRNLILGILNTPGPGVEAHDRILQAVTWYVEKDVDLIDACDAAWMLDEVLWLTPSIGIR